MLTIAWDVDDVLNNFMYDWLNKEWLTENPLSSVVFKNLTENPPKRILKISKNEYLNSLDKFRFEKYFEEVFPKKY